MVSPRSVLLSFLILLPTCDSFVVRSSFASRQRIAFNASPEELAQELREQAEQLREEVASFQREKELVAEVERKNQEQIRQEKESIRNRYSARVPILKGDGSTVVEQVDFPPRWPSESSYILTCEASLPLGIILGESETMSGLIVVDEVGDGSNGALAGVQVGDIVRACTACRAMMKAPTWQILAGGIGMPETCRFMYSVDGRPFEEVMEAIGSNRMDPTQRPLLLVLERKGVQLL